ncbi:MAG: winged helix-turn-helix domain-containing protein [Ornithinimicrobium sp.]|uniref:winged helix-turn-helix domain-containing protein n=1 Tax=Ornithinimicrobium sp. TaxID=1977084 RepID=UPI003D9AF963
MTPTLSVAQARRIALAAQGFGRPTPAGPVTRRHLVGTAARLQVVQIDSVNVLARSHYLPFWSRLGSYEQAGLDALRDGRSHGTGEVPTAKGRALVEHWAHEASLVPVTTWPYLGYRSRTPRVQGWSAEIEDRHPGLLEAVLDVVAVHGPLTARAVEQHLPHGAQRRTDGWGWNWSAVKTCVEHLFLLTRVTSAGRTAQFERRYAMPEHVLPAEVLARAPGQGSAPDDQECAVQLMRRSIRAHGIGTEPCLRDYFRLRPDRSREALAILLHQGEVEPVAIRGWDRPAYLDPTARRPRSVRARALLSPFDSLIWQRERTERLFGFRYRLEIYVPAARRVHGYYVLPFLLGDRLAARVDLKADREGGRLLVRALHLEPDAPPDTLRELYAELDALAQWLGLARVALP